MPPDDAELLLRAAHLLLEQNFPQTPIAEKREPPAWKEEAIVGPSATQAQEKGVSVLDELLGLMLTDANVLDKIVRSVTERQRQMRDDGPVVGEARVELKFSRPAGQKIGITMCENFNVEKLKKDLAAVHQLGFNCVAGYAC